MQSYYLLEDFVNHFVHRRCAAAETADFTFSAVNGVPAAAPSATSSHGGGGGLLARVKRVLFSSADGLPPTTAVSSPLLGLVGAQVGLRLGLDFVCEDQSADGNFEIEWLGTKHIIPFLDEVRQ
ncbi:Hypothetical protein, putative [Bodo saltans]|uniref:Uncharacterized protein n=1 Tax=Bodo saltans TaxID=75058 RepID=A0A0S4J797_BODSA|nr:Hypothetical protein, putative [Bodo saltans]|eukprot:CUG85704.1 Hypothetical protein, putative [Bodo saltans]